MAIIFNGTSQHALRALAGTFGSGDPQSICVFIKPDADTNGYSVSLNDNVEWMHFTQRVQTGRAAGGRLKTLTSIQPATVTVAADTWVPCVITHDGAGNVNQYIGSTTPQAATGSPSTVTWDDLLIGAAYQTGSVVGDHYKGKIAYVLPWTRVLTAGEISTFINATSTADIDSLGTSGLIDRYDLISDGNSDAAGTNLTLVGSPAFDADDPLAAAGGVTVTDVDTDEDVYPGQTVTITGTGFGATQSSGSVTIDGVAQVVTSWADTSIQITVTQGDLKYGAHTLQVTNSLAESGALGITLSADTANNYLYVDVVDPANSDSTAFSYNTTPAVATGDQLEVQFFAPITSMTVQADTLISSVDSAGTAAARFWDATTSTWGPIETFDIAESGAVDNWTFGKGITPAAPETWTWGKRHPKTGMRVRVYK